MTTRAPRSWARGLGAIILCSFVGLVLPGQEATTHPIDAGFARTSLAYLASDELLGRDTPSAELDTAAGWLAAQCKSFRLEPAFASGFQDGPFRPDRERSSAQLLLGGRTLSFSGDQVVAADPVPAGAPLEVVSWTFGNEAGVLPGEELLRGRALLLWDTPQGPADAGRQTLLWRRLARRLEERGAAALILGVGSAPTDLRIRVPIVFGQPLERPPSIEPRGLISGASLSVSVPASNKRFASNVGAIRRGSDPQLRDQYIVFSAHYDHVGVGREVQGDRIYNGADDNASGTVAVLALARAFAAQEIAPRRSVMFLFFYGEERGFLGSTHFCEHPPIPLQQIGAVFNIEMVGRPDDIQPKSAWITGWKESDFGTLVAAAGAAAGIRFYERPGLSDRLFGASDNLPFAQRGVPAHSISAGSLHRDYHQPSDSLEKIDIANLTAVVHGIFVAGRVMADGGTLPTWSATSSYRRPEARPAPR